MFSTIVSMGIFLGLGTLGYAAGPYLGAFICEHFGYEKVFYIFNPLDVIMVARLSPSCTNIVDNKLSSSSV